MASSGFQFKQFFVAHDQCAMKVNTDGILLGAIADIQHAKQILDIGTGTGLVALMLAQRTQNNDVQLTGLEIESAAFQQAMQNVASSPWAARILLLQRDLFQQQFANTFDLIVSNPPYFADSVPTRSHERDLARTLRQSHLAWLTQAKKCLSPQGKITFILPSGVGETLCEQAESLGLYCTEKWHICTKAGKAPKRQILTWQGEKGVLNEKNLVIYQQDNQYSNHFKALTKAFYLNF